jgi:hypothetical protein
MIAPETTFVHNTRFHLQYLAIALEPNWGKIEEVNKSRQFLFYSSLKFSGILCQHCMQFFTCQLKLGPTLKT